jgi:hypothetical protein
MANEYPGFPINGGQYFNEQDRTWYSCECSYDQNGNLTGYDMKPVLEPRKDSSGNTVRPIQMVPKTSMTGADLSQPNTYILPQHFPPDDDPRNQEAWNTRNGKNGTYTNPKFVEGRRVEITNQTEKIFAGFDIEGNPIYIDQAVLKPISLKGSVTNSNQMVWEPLMPRGDWIQQKLKPHVIFISDIQRGSGRFGQSLKLWIPPKETDWSKDSAFQIADVAGQLSKPREWTGGSPYSFVLDFPLILDWAADLRYDVWPVMMWLKMCQGHLLRITYAHRLTDESVWQSMQDLESLDYTKNGNEDCEAYSVTLDSLKFKTIMRHGISYFPEYVQCTMNLTQRG